jgi:hypothetical protein
VRYPSIPKPPSPPTFNPNFGPKGSPSPSELGGGPLGVKPPKPPTPPTYGTPGRSNPNGPYPLGGSRPAARPNGSTMPSTQPAPPPPPSAPSA